MARSVIATLPARTLARHRADLIDHAHGAATPADLFTVVSKRLRRLVPFDGALWMGTDPASGLPTVPTVLENLAHADPGQCLSYWESEFLVEDVNLFRDLSNSDTPAAGLRERTDDRPARCSPRAILVGTMRAVHGTSTWTSIPPQSPFPRARTT